MSLKEWLICGLVILPFGVLIALFGANSVSGKTIEKAGEFCERVIRQSLNMEVDWQQAQFLQLGTTSKYTSNDGLLFVWNKSAARKEIKCATSLNTKEIRFLSVGGENLTNLMMREER